METTVLTIPYGEILTSLSGYLAIALMGAVAWGLRKLPAEWSAIAKTAQVEQLLERAIIYGINSVPGAARGKTVEMNVGSRVLKEALAYALIHSSDAVRAFIGSPIDMAEKIWSRLELGEDSYRPDFRAVVAQVALTLPDKAAKDMPAVIVTKQAAAAAV